MSGERPTDAVWVCVSRYAQKCWDGSPFAGSDDHADCTWHVPYVPADRAATIPDGLRELAEQVQGAPTDRTMGWAGRKLADAVLALAAAPPTAEPGVATVIGWMVLIADGLGGWAADWDGEVYTDRADADHSLAEASVEWGAVLAEMRQITDRSDAAAATRCPECNPDPTGPTPTEASA